jgi:hypothetical protein
VWTYNCARVYVGKYSVGHIAFMPQDDTYQEVSCNYKVIEGDVTIKTLRPVRVKGATDSLNSSPYPKAFTVLETFVLYPKTDSAIIEVFNRNGKHQIKLVKNAEDKSTIYKMRF